MVALCQNSSDDAGGRKWRGKSETQSAARSVFCPERYSEIRHTFVPMSVRANVRYVLSVYVPAFYIVKYIPRLKG